MRNELQEEKEAAEFERREFEQMRGAYKRLNALQKELRGLNAFTAAERVSGAISALWVDLMKHPGKY
jgi:hypothetical protein